MSILKDWQWRLHLFLSRRYTPVKRVISFWERGGVDFDYYKKADSASAISVFWAQESTFYSLFQQLDISLLLEVACGTGRHAA
jgi:hypothetical protein